MKIVPNRQAHRDDDTQLDSPVGLPESSARPGAASGTVRLPRRPGRFGLQDTAAMELKLSDSRRARVQAVKLALREGRYHVSSERVAGSILTKLLVPRTRPN